MAKEGVQVVMARKAIDRLTTRRHLIRIANCTNGILDTAIKIFGVNT